MAIRAKTSPRTEPRPRPRRSPDAILPPDLQRIIDLQERRVAGMNRKAARDIARLVAAARKELLAKMATTTAPFTLQRYQSTLVQFNRVLAAVERRFGGLIDASLSTAIKQGAADAVAQVTAGAKAFRMAEVAVSLPEAQKIVRGSTILRRVEAKRAVEARQLYGEKLTARVEQSLAHSLTLGESVSDAATRLLKNEDLWKRTRNHAETIVRTEFSEAYNGSLKVALDDVAKGNPTLALMWHEHARGPAYGGPTKKAWPGMAEPLDDRVADDSLRMHGQVRRPGEKFEDPETGKTFDHPPNRPRDRSVIVMVRIDPKTGKVLD